MAQNCRAPVRVRRHPDTFCFSLIMRMSRSVPLFEYEFQDLASRAFCLTAAGGEHRVPPGGRPLVPGGLVG